VKLALEAPLHAIRVGTVMKIEGVALTTGTFYGMEGQKVKCTHRLLINSVDSLVGKPIIYPHTTDTLGEERLVVGFISAAWIEGDELKFEGYVWDKNVFDLLVEGVGFSIEAEKIGEDELNFLALALTENPACPSCRVTEAKPVKMEEERSEVDLMGEEIKVPAESGTEEAVEMEKKDFWTLLSDKLAGAGFDKQQITKIINVIKALLPTAYYLLPKYPYPYPYPKPKKAEAPEAEESEELKALKAELETLKAERDALLDEKITRLTAAIKEIDKSFNPDEFGIEDKKTLIVLLEKYLGTVKKFSKKVKLEIASDSLDTEIKKKVIEMFGEGEW